MSGVQSACSTVSGLPSVLAKRMAVIGRQNSKKYFASQHEIAPSDIAAFSRANSLALSDRLLCVRIKLLTAVRFQKVSAVAAQKRAASVWSAVRKVLVSSPTAFTSLKSAVYSGLVMVKANRRLGRKLHGSGMTHGSV